MASVDTDFVALAFTVADQALEIRELRARLAAAEGELATLRAAQQPETP